MVVDTSGISLGRDDCLPKRQIHHRHHKKQEQHSNNNASTPITLYQFESINIKFLIEHFLTIIYLQYLVVHSISFYYHGDNITSPNLLVRRNSFSLHHLLQHQDSESFYLRVLCCKIPFVRAIVTAKIHRDCEGVLFALS